MRILIATDAWAPQVNGVVRTLLATRHELERRGREVAILSPDLFRSVACPTYPEIRLALAGRRDVGDRIAAFAPDSIHIATEGPLGLAARRACLDRNWRFTTAYHTQFPDYVARRTGLPAAWFWRYIKWFHRPSQAILVATAHPAKFREIVEPLTGSRIEMPESLAKLFSRPVSCEDLDPELAALSAALQNT